MIHSNIFWRTVISGFIATYIMSMTAFIQGGISFPVLDIGHFLTESFNYIHDHNPYSIVWGTIAYYIKGIILAIVWVTLLKPKMPGNWLIHSLLYSVILSVVAGLIVSPLVSLSAGESFGLFYTETWAPFLIIVAGFIMHLAYALALMLSLEIAGVK